MFQYSEKDLEYYFGYIEEKFGEIDFVSDIEGVDNEVICRIVGLKEQEFEGRKSYRYFTIGLANAPMEDHSISEIFFDFNSEPVDDSDELKFMMHWIFSIKDIVRDGGEILPGLTAETTGQGAPFNSLNTIFLFPAEDVWRINAETVRINILNALPIYSEELMYKNNHGPIELLNRLYHFGLPFPLDFNRPNTCIGQVKELKIKQENIKTISEEKIAFRSCIVSDSIMVDGNKVGLCMREEAIDGEGSGWIFISGLEDEAYLSNMDNFGIYSVQHVLNYDKEIALILNTKPTVIFQRDEDGIFQTVESSWQLEVMSQALDEAVFREAKKEGKEFEYDGNIHMYKVRAKGLDTDEIMGLNHVAIYFRAMIELGFVDGNINEEYQKACKEIVDKGASYPLRELIRDRFEGYLPYELLNEEGKLFTRKYIEQDYTMEVDVYTKKRYLDEGKNPEDAQTEEYLFIEYDEAYYEHMKTWLDEKSECFRKKIFPARKEGKLSLQLRAQIEDLEERMKNGEDIEYLEIYTFIMDELFKKSDEGIFEVEEILADSTLYSEIGEYLLKEDSFEAMMLLITITDHGFADAKKEKNGKWFHLFGYAFLRRGFIFDALDLFEEGKNCDPDYIMNWYYSAILLLIDKSRGKEEFGKTMNYLASLEEKPYLVEKLISSLREGVSDPEKLILHMDSLEEDEVLHNKLRKDEPLSEEEYKRKKLSETMTIDNEGIDSIKFIIDGNLKESDGGEPIIILGKENPLELVFSMAKGVFSKLNKNFVEDLNIALASEGYRAIEGFDGKKYKLISLLMDENYKMYLRYYCEEDDAMCILTLNREDRDKFIFPDEANLRDMFNDTLSIFLNAYDK